MHPTVTTEAQAIAIIDAEFTEIKRNPSHKLTALRQQFLNPERHLQASKATLSEVTKHYLEESVFAKAIITYIDKLSETPDPGANTMQITIDLPDHLYIVLSQQSTELNLSLEDYLLHLIATENFVLQVLKDDLKPNHPTDPDDTPIDQIITGLRQGWHDAMTGNTIPIAQLWDDIDTELDDADLK
jgi:hypothetical protein